MEVEYMPRFDGTGPQGVGPTGWGMGPCGAGARRGPGFRRAFGRGYGRGFGRRFAVYADQKYVPYTDYPEQTSLTKEEQKKILESEIKEIAIEKEMLEKRLKELK